MPFRDVVLTAFIFAILPICFTRPWVGIIAWYWLGLMNPHRQTWNFAYTMPFGMLIGGATLIGALLTPERERKPIPWNAQLTLIVVLMVYFTITTFFSWYPAHAWIEWEKVFKIVLMTLVATMFIYGHDRIRTLMWTIVVSIGFYGVKGFFFVLRSGGGERVQGPDNSFMEGNTFIGLAFNMVVPLMIFMARDEQRPWLKRALYAMAFCTIVSTIFTYSRGAYIGLVVMIPLIWLRAEKKVIGACILIPAALLAPIVLPEKVFQRADTIEGYEQDRSANQRLQSWTVAFNIAKDYPLNGAGFDFEYAPDDTRWLSYSSEKYDWALNHSSAAHSVYFQLMGQHGFLALFLFLALAFGTMVSLGRTKKRARENKETEWVAAYATGIQVGLVGYMVSGAFLSSAYFDLAWLYFALSAVLAREVVPVPRRLYGLAPRFAGAAASGQPPAPRGAALAAPGGSNSGRRTLIDQVRAKAPRNQRPKM